MKVEFFGNAYEVLEEEDFEVIEEFVKDRAELIKKLVEYIESSEYNEYLCAELKILEEVPLEFHKIGDVYLKIYGKDEIFIVFGIKDENGLDPYEEITIGEVEVM